MQVVLLAAAVAINTPSRSALLQQQGTAQTQLAQRMAAVEQDITADTRLQQLAVGGVGIEGGQGESDSIFGSHDDHSTYGVAGSGWQGMGNGENPGELWNPAVGGRMGGGQQLRQMAHPFGRRIRRQSLAGSVPYPEPGCCENGWCYCRINGD